MTQTVTIVLRPDAAAAERTVIGARLRTVPEVADPRPLVPGSTVPDVQRLWIADVADTADAAAVAERVRVLPEVEFATVAAERGLDV